MTSTSDDLQIRTDDPDSPPPPRAARRGPPDPPPSDEASVLSSSALEGAEPDPMLGGSSSWDLARAIRDRPPASEPTPGVAAGLGVDVDFSEKAAPRGSRSTDDGAEESYDWAGLILRSYASAVTLGLVWFLWVGKVTPPAPPREALAPRRRPVEPVPASTTNAAASPAARTTAIGKAVVVGDLEVTPLLVHRRSVRLVRDLGDEALVREHADCLALTIRLKNLSDDLALTPIATSDLADGDGFAIDAGAGPKIAMFALDPGGGWTVEDQAFPEIAPGEVADVVLLSEPLGDRRLPAHMTWRFRVAIDPERTQREALGVTFGPNDLP